MVDSLTDDNKNTIEYDSFTVLTLMKVDNGQYKEIDIASKNTKSSNDGEPYEDEQVIMINYQ